MAIPFREGPSFVQTAFQLGSAPDTADARRARENCFRAMYSVGRGGGVQSR